MSSPEKKFLVGNVSCSVFRAVAKKDEDESHLFKTVALQKSYQEDGKTKYSDSVSLNTNEIPKAILALKKSYEYLLLRLR